MASIFARAYKIMIIAGKRTIEDVKPEALREETAELLAQEGLDTDGKPFKVVVPEEEPKEETPKEEGPKEEAPKEEKPKEEAPEEPPKEETPKDKEGK